MIHRFTIFSFIAAVLIVSLATSTLPINAQSSSCSIPVTQSYANLSLTVINQVLDLHNAARRSTTPLASDMKMLTWNDRLSFAAEDFLQSCAGFNTHSSQQYRQSIAGFSYVGENLGASSSATLTQNEFSIFVNLWNDEKDFWTHQASPCGTAAVCGSCATNPQLGVPMCGHYTQNVWSETTQLGCAFYNGCGYGSMYACLYNAGGNIRGRQVFAANTASGAAAPPCESAVPHTIVSRSNAGDVTATTSSPTSSNGGGGGTPSPNNNNNNNNNPSPNNGAPTSNGDSDGSEGLATGALVGIIVGGVAVVALIGVGVFAFIRSRQRKSWESGEDASQNYLFAQPAAAPQIAAGQKGDDELVVGLMQEGALTGGNVNHNDI